MFYSALTGGWYKEHYDGAPTDLVEVPHSEYLALLEGASSGKKLTANKKGYPVLVDHDAPSSQEKQAIINSDAKAFLASTDWYVVRKAETGQEIPPDVLDARARARASVVVIE